MPEPLLEVRQLSKHYPTRSGLVRALDGVTLEVFPGETLAVVGESGSGKTTLANMILGAEGATGGELKFSGQPLTANRSLALRRQIQYVQQNPMTTLNPRRTIFQSIRVPLQTHRVGSAVEQRKRAAELLEVVGMSADYLDRFPSALSGGQRQRVAIARALTVEPKLLVLDEPTSALDVSVQAKVLALLVELQAKFKLTYIFITHDLSVVRNVAGRVVVMYRGKAVELGPTAELFRDPEHPYTRMLISSIPVVSEEEEALKPPWPWERNLALDSGKTSQGCPFAPRCPFAEQACWDQVPAPAAVREGHQSACHMVSGVIPNRLVNG
ncbi:MAG: ABC transporter ATP-binding protein [Meiothermus sp.]|nr:ABC transporter ATP-binding protein [Meiothermus sp.]